MAYNVFDVANALNGVTTPQPVAGESDLQLIRGGAAITTNGDGSYTINAGPLEDTQTVYPSVTFTDLGTVTIAGNNLTNSGYFGAGVTSKQLPVLSWVYAGSTYYAYPLGFNGTQVLLVGATPSSSPPTATSTWTQNFNRFLLTTNGPDLALATNNVTVAQTGNSYTAPNGTPVSCFVSGTRITTPTGDVLVEDLAAGDLVTTLSGESKPVVWAGRRTLRVSTQRRPELVRPVTIRAGAFGANLPSRDLTVSADHNVFTDGVLIPAKCLVNGLNVVEDDRDLVTYHHIELAEHDVVFAEGLPTETYLEVGNRTSFTGGAVVDMEPDFATTPDTNYFAWEARGFAPLVLSGATVEAVRARLAAQANATRDAGRRAA